MKEVHVSNVPYGATEEDLKSFLENITSRGAVCFCELKRDSFNTAHKGFGFVTFVEDKVAELVRSRASDPFGLRFQGRSLRINVPNRRLRHNPEHSTTRLEARWLVMGCCTNANFHCLWSTTSTVVVEVDFRDRKLHLKLATTNNESRTSRKLECPFKYIYSIQSAKIVERRNSPMLLVEIWQPPLIYHEANFSHRDTMQFDFLFSSLHLQNQPSQPWIRTVDFTPKRSIGQSFAYLLQLCDSTTNNSELLKVLKNLGDYRLVSPGDPIRRLNLMDADSYADPSPQVLVPLLRCPKNISIPFKVMFTLNYLVQVGNLSGPSITTEFFRLLSESPPEQVLWVMQRLSQTSTMKDKPDQWLRRELSKIERGAVRIPRSTCINLQDGQIWVYRLFLSPAKVYCVGPEAEVSNRVTREYSHAIDNFLRVSFIEEDWTNLSSQALINSEGLLGQSDVYKRIRAVLREGIWLMDKHYEFLAFSSSQLREQSVWMFARTQDLTAQTIRRWMGDFLGIRNVAKCAARMGQCFSSTTKTLAVSRWEVNERLQDVQTADGKYTFSDGIGMISMSFAKKVAAKCGQHSSVPSAFQIRYGGYKGVVAAFNQEQYKLWLRPSMKKFDSEHFDLEVISWTKRLPCYLNRQVITLLATLGIQDYIFVQMQNLVLSKLNEVLSNRAVALDLLQITSSGATHQTTMEMLKAGYSPSSEPYLRSLLQAFRAFQLLQLRTKSRILVPKGRTLMGCLDETGILDYGEVFARVSSFPGTRSFLSDGLRYEEDGRCVLTGAVVVAKNPCLHPGDVRVLQAIDVPELYHMVDCVVFPQRGHRPHPNECSGSDLDGDLYFLTWDAQLIPLQMAEPMEYSSPQPIELHRPVDIEDIQEFFVDYMKSDSLGLIANAHVVHADKEPLMARDHKCMALAKLFAVAVDFPKTGKPAVMDSSLRAVTYPDFMEKDDKNSYRSERVLGKLFRAVVGDIRGTMLVTSSTRSEIVASFDKDLVWPGFDVYIREAKMFKSWYDAKLVGLMNQYGLKTEAEALSGNILPLSKYYVKRQGDVRDRISLAVRSLQSEARGWFKHGYDGKDQYPTLDDGEEDEDYTSYYHSEEYHPTKCNPHALRELEAFAKASAWYHVTYHSSYMSRPDPNDDDYLASNADDGGYLLSFPWAVWDTLLAIKRRKQG